MMQQGNIVRVKAKGKFNGQEVEVLKVEIPRVKTKAGEKVRRWYQLDVNWDGTPRPSWFEDFEVERVAGEP